MYPTKGTNSIEYRQLITSEDDKCSEAKEATDRNNRSVTDSGDLHQMTVLESPSHTALTQLLNIFTLRYLKGIQIQRNFSFNMYWELKLYVRMNCNIRSSGRISESEKTSHAEDMAP